MYVWRFVLGSAGPQGFRSAVPVDCLCTNRLFGLNNFVRVLWGLCRWGGGGRGKDKTHFASGLSINLDDGGVNTSKLKEQIPCFYSHRWVISIYNSSNAGKNSGSPKARSGSKLRRFMKAVRSQTAFFVTLL